MDSKLRTQLQELIASVKPGTSVWEELGKVTTEQMLDIQSNPENWITCLQGEYTFPETTSPLVKLILDTEQFTSELIAHLGGACAVDTSYENRKLQFNKPDGTVLDATAFYFTALEFFWRIHFYNNTEYCNLYPENDMRPTEFISKIVALYTHAPDESELEKQREEARVIVCNLIEEGIMQEY